MEWVKKNLKKTRSTNNDSLDVCKNTIDRNKQLEYYCTHLNNYLNSS